MTQASIMTVADCTVVFGSADVEWINKQAKSFVFAPDLASLVGANLVLGTPEAIANLRITGFPIEMLRPYQVEHAALNGAPAAIIGWLSSGDRTPATDTLSSHLFGFPHITQPSDPVDLEDVLRCVFMIDAIFLKPDDFNLEYYEELEPMQDISPMWDAVLRNYLAYYRLARHEELNENQLKQAARLFQKTLGTAEDIKKRNQYLKEHDSLSPFEVAEKSERNG